MQKKAMPMVWFHSGFGFEEEEKQAVSVTEGEVGRIYFTVTVPKGATNMRLIPADFQCLTMISRLYLTGKEKKLLTYTSNGVKLSNHTTAFVNADPYFEIDIADCEEQTIFIELLVEPTDGEVLVDLIEGDLVNLKFQLENAKRDNEILLNSMCWKITKPLRIAMDILKRKEKRERVSKEQIDFQLLIASDGDKAENIKTSLESLQKQTYQKWNVSIFMTQDGKTKLEENCNDLLQADRRIKLELIKAGATLAESCNEFMQTSKAQFLVFLNNGEFLEESALSEFLAVIQEKKADFIYSDEDVYDNFPLKPYWPNYKPDFAPDMLRSQNYIGNFFAIKKSLFLQIGGVSEGYETSYQYDLILKATEQAEKIVHIPKVLMYQNRDRANKTHTPPQLEEKALVSHLERIGRKAKITRGNDVSTYRVQYEIKGNPLVSILIPNKDHTTDLSKCIDSIIAKSTNCNFEIIIIENNSELEDTFAYYEQLQQRNNITVVTWEKGFNYSAINNFGYQYAKGEYILLLNNDIEVITPDWLEEMVGYAQQKEIGAVGAMLLYPDDTVQHAGAVYGICGLVGHVHKNYAKEAEGYYQRLQIAQNYSCVTAACLLVKRETWEAVEGLDERFEVAFNDIDFCLRIRKKGYLIVMTPFAKLYHYESKSRGAEDTKEKLERFHREIALFRQNWNVELLEGDPYYNKNLTVHRDDYFFRV